MSSIDKAAWLQKAPLFFSKFFPDSPDTWRAWAAWIEKAGAFPRTAADLRRDIALNPNSARDTCARMFSECLSKFQQPIGEARVAEGVWAMLARDEAREASLAEMDRQQERRRIYQEAVARATANATPLPLSPGHVPTDDDLLIWHDMWERYESDFQDFHENWKGESDDQAPQPPQVPDPRLQKDLMERVEKALERATEQQQEDEFEADEAE